MLNDLIDDKGSAQGSREVTIQDAPDFSYDGYQVVRGEFFAHLFEPSISINREKVSVNTACLRKLEDVEYVQFLVNPIEKKLAVKACDEEAKASIKWASGTGKGRKPRSITCRIFYAKLMALMGWDPEYRYKILGKLIRAKSDLLFVFDLNSAETYRKEEGKNTGRGLPMYPEEWKNQFGVPVKEHPDTLQIDIFDDYAVFRINREEEKRAAKEAGNCEEPGERSVDAGSEEAADADS